MAAAPSSRIRPATPDDIPAIVDCIRALARYEKLEHEFVGNGDLLREHLFGAQPACECLMAEEAAAGGTDTVGFALFFTCYSTFWTQPFLHLEDLFVFPEHRGKGHGEALLRTVAKTAQTRGYPRLQWNVLDWNEPAIGFYKKLGATILGDWRTCRVAGESLATLATMNP